MKIFLLGKNGQLGQELAEQAKKFGFFVYGYGHKELDILDTNNVEKELTKINPDVVINATAYHIVADCEAHPDKAFAVNTTAVKNLAVLCFAKEIKLLNFSTDYVFDGCKGSPYIEADAPNPLQMYGISKLAGEIVSLNYNPKSVVIRTCGVYGGKTGSKSKGGNFILNIIKEAKKKEVLEVSSEQIVSPTYATDLAQAMLKLLRNKSVSGIFHLVNEGYCSWAQLAQEVMIIKRLKVKIIPVDRSGQSGGVKRPLFSALANIKAKKLGIVLPVWQDAVRRYISDFSL